MGWSGLAAAVIISDVMAACLQALLDKTNITTKVLSVVQKVWITLITFYQSHVMPARHTQQFLYPFLYCMLHQH